MVGPVPVESISASSRSIRARARIGPVIYRDVAASSPCFTAPPEIVARGVGALHGPLPASLGTLGQRFSLRRSSRLRTRPAIARRVLPGGRVSRGEKPAVIWIAPERDGIPSLPVVLLVARVRLPGTGPLLGTVGCAARSAGRPLSPMPPLGGMPALLMLVPGGTPCRVFASGARVPGFGYRLLSRLARRGNGRPGSGTRGGRGYVSVRFPRILDRPGVVRFVPLRLARAAFPAGARVSRRRFLPASFHLSSTGRGGFARGGVGRGFPGRLGILGGSGTRWFDGGVLAGGTRACGALGGAARARALLRSRCGWPGRGNGLDQVLLGHCASTLHVQTSGQFQQLLPRHLPQLISAHYDSYLPFRAARTEWRSALLPGALSSGLFSFRIVST